MPGIVFPYEKENATLRKELEPLVALLPCSSGNMMIEYGEICAWFYVDRLKWLTNHEPLPET